MVKTLTELLGDLYHPYASGFDQMTARFGASGLSGPVLISPSDTLYAFQKVKLLVVAPEIRNWPAAGVEEGMRTYAGFPANPRRNKSFFGLRAKFEKVFGVDTNQSGWASLGKFSFKMTALDVIYRQEISAFDCLLIGEMIRLRPDVVIFLTGAEHDKRLAAQFDGMRFRPVEGFDYHELVTVHHVFFPRKAFRLCQPDDLHSPELLGRIIRQLALYA